VATLHANGNEEFVCHLEQGCEEQTEDLQILLLILLLILFEIFIMAANLSPQAPSPRSE
jgi:hypothetical protein